MANMSSIKEKLKGIGPIVWINLDTELRRQAHMNNLFSNYGIPNTRIAAIDARGNNDVSNLLAGSFPKLVTPGELGCAMSHLKAIKYFHEETDLDFIVICEDDITFDTVPYWPFSWIEFISHAPYDWDVLQCAITSTKNIRVNLHPRLINDFCAAVYVITRHHASKILKHHTRGDQYKLDQNLKPRATSEEIIFNSGRTYSIPLFTYRYDSESSIHQDHVGMLHKNNAEGVTKFWKNRPPKIGTEQLLDYDFHGFWAPLVDS